MLAAANLAVGQHFGIDSGPWVERKLRLIASF